MENKVVKFDQYLTETNIHRVKCHVIHVLEWGASDVLEIKLIRTNEHGNMIKQDFLLCFDTIYFSGVLEWDGLEIVSVTSEEKSDLIKPYILNKYNDSYFLQKYEMLKFKTSYDTFIYIAAEKFIVSQIPMSEAQKTYESLKSILDSDAIIFYKMPPKDVIVVDVEYFADVIRDLSQTELVECLTMEFRDRITSMNGFLELLQGHAEFQDRWQYFAYLIVAQADKSILDNLPAIHDYLEVNRNNQVILPNNFGNNSSIFKDLPPAEVIRIYIDKLAKQLVKIIENGKLLFERGYDLELLGIMQNHVKEIIMLRNELKLYVEPTEWH